ncbi:hypothetical protein [Stenotrophomonas phage StenR_269]|nr:hypothetical protein [Stenotrophomonas phage StenR_269]
MKVRVFRKDESTIDEITDVFKIEGHDKPDGMVVVWHNRHIVDFEQFFDKVLYPMREVSRIDVVRS